MTVSIEILSKPLQLTFVLTGMSKQFFTSPSQTSLALQPGPASGPVCEGGSTAPVEFGRVDDESRVDGKFSYYDPQNGGGWFGDGVWWASGQHRQHSWSNTVRKMRQSACLLPAGQWPSVAAASPL